jgi:hypothetical protein
MASSTLHMPQYITPGHRSHPTQLPFLGPNSFSSPPATGHHHHHPSSLLSLRNNPSFANTSYPSSTVCSATVVAPNEGTSAEGSPTPYSLQFRWGVGAEQGPRDTMEDVTQVVTDGCCGFFFAST